MRKIKLGTSFYLRKFSVWERSNRIKGLLKGYT